MKYRQWKKNYKKKHGVNPPLELDKRKQRRLARKMARQINKTLPTAAETLTAAINRWAQSIKPALATLCENVAAAFLKCISCRAWTMRKSQRNWIQERTHRGAGLRAS